jgi:fructose transport system substrate-binding protein
MHQVLSPAARWRRRGMMVGAAGLTAAALAVSACGSDDDSGTASGASANGGKKDVKVALILKTFSNPYFVSMQKSAEAEADKLGVDLVVSAGSSDSDTAAQLKAINNAIAGDFDGIVIASNGDAVNASLQKARTAGIYTIAVDTVPTPPSTVNLTYATDNTAAGRIIGEWTSAKLDGKPATIALLDAVNTSAISVDVQRNHGFLEGMGIPVGDPKVNGKAPKSGDYTGGKGGTYTIACELPTGGAIPQGKSAMQTCLQKNPDINVVYAVNEPAGEGASQALADAKNDAIVVAIDGGCGNLKFVESGAIDATAAQFPGKMASLGVTAVHDLITKDEQPATSPGEEFFDTGVKLFTNDPLDGIESVNVAEAKEQCWG